MVPRAGNENFTPELDGPRVLRPEEYSSALKLLNAVLRPDGPRGIQKEYPLVLGKKNLQNMRVIARGREIISHAAIYFSTLVSGELSFNVGGISSVATHPAYRRQGLGSSVMRDCIRIMEDSSCHLSILWTQEQEFYRNLGYEVAGSSYLFKLSAADLPKLSGNCKVISYSPRRLPDIINIHRREKLRTERTAKEYETYFGLPKTKALLARRGSEITAYAVMGKGEDLRNCIHDWGGNPQDLLSIVRKFADTTQTGELMILAPGQENEFTRVLRQMNIPSAFECLAMMRIIDVEGTSSVVRNHLSSRLDREFSLSRSDAGVEVRIGDEGTLVQPERNLARLLFGPDPPSSLLGSLSHETLSALDAALPIPLFIWGLDSV